LYDLLTDPSVLPAAVMPPDGSGPAALPELERELGEEAQRGESAPFRLALPPVSLSPESRCSSAGDPAPLRRGSRTAVGRALKLARGISRSERRQRPERVAAHPAAGGG